MKSAESLELALFYAAERLGPLRVVDGRASLLDVHALVALAKP